MENICTMLLVLCLIITLQSSLLIPYMCVVHVNLSYGYTREFLMKFKYCSAMKLALFSNINLPIWQ